ncbi:hypothetical protein [Psychroserpens luteus]|uniref:Uncharacterized protein n=1 Tax=Psychroserpens luteus TaxID=1434066 RepID=A0ABW5ZY58_9FLAO|nr:hypothetical protein [Psychroserpens luteus]
MIKKRVIIITIIYLLINSATFWMIRNGHLPIHGSFNVLLSLMFSKIFGIENFLIGSLIYLTGTTIVIYGLSESAKKKYEIVLLIILVFGISIPFLNLNGL